MLNFLAVPCAFQVQILMGDEAGGTGVGTSIGAWKVVQVGVMEGGGVGWREESWG